MIKLSKPKLIALDLDETTLNENGQLTDKTMGAIVKAISEGIHIVIASGRAYTALPKEVLEITGVEYAITSNGAAIYRISDEKCIHQCKINPDSVENVLRLKNDFPVTFEAFIDGKAYADSRYVADPTVFGVTERAKHYLQATRMPIDDISGFIREHIDRLDSIDVVVPNVETRDIIAELASNADKEIYVTSSVKYLVEIAYKDAGKGMALRRLCDMLSVELDDCIAFGNADNDIDMLKACGVGVAVSNATQGCLDAADIIAPSHKDDGVAKIIERILNNK
jgi:Cof subfamily protein (haloacid dehalogenase superfamily)